MAKYSDKFKADSVVMLTTAGYPDNPYKLEEVARYLKVPSRSLRRWYYKQNGAPPDELVREEKAELADMFESVARKMLLHAGDEDVIDQMYGKDAVIAAATATDKMRLLRGLPTEIIEVVPKLVTALQDAGLDPVETFNKMLQRANERANNSR